MMERITEGKIQKNLIKRSDMRRVILLECDDEGPSRSRALEIPSRDYK